MKIFVTGTDTGVGKTVVSSLLARFFDQAGKTVAVYKPVETGCPVLPDGQLIANDLNFIRRWYPVVDVYHSYLFQQPVAPAVAAVINSVPISVLTMKDTLKTLEERYDVVIVEGAGGLYVPIVDNYLYADFAQECCLKTLVVARPLLGTINHTLLTIDCLRFRSIDLFGIVISNYPENTNDPAIQSAPEVIQHYTQSKVYLLPHVPHLETSAEANDLLYQKFLEFALQLFNLECRI